MSPSWSWLIPEGDEPGPADSTTYDQVRSALRSHSSLAGTARRVAELTASTVPGANEAGVTLLTDGAVVLAAGSSQLAVDADALQHRAADAPGRTAIADGRSVYVGSLADDDRWPRFSADAAQLGIGSALALPLRHDGEPMGWLSVYAEQPYAFLPAALAAGERLAEAAAVSLSASRLLVGAHTLADALHELLSAQAIVDTAVGILMERNRFDAAAGEQHLQALADAHRLSVDDLAWSIVAAAVTWSTHRQGTRPWADELPDPAVPDPAVPDPAVPDLDPTEEP